MSPRKARRSPKASREDTAVRKARADGLRRAFKQACVSHGLPAPASECLFHPSRMWRFDYAWPVESVALEVEGGVWTGGRHVRGSGFLKDIEKMNAAASQGWRVLRCTPSTLFNWDTFDLIARTMGIQ